MLPITLKCIREGKSFRRLARMIDQDLRHAHFLLQNARILGFVASNGGKHSLTTSGNEFLDASPRLRGFLLCKALLSSKVVSALVEKKGTLEEAAHLSIEEISDFLIENAVVSGTDNSPMQRVTTNRRASSVRQWLSWLVTNLPCISETPRRNNGNSYHDTPVSEQLDQKG